MQFLKYIDVSLMSHSKLNEISHITPGTQCFVMGNTNAITEMLTDPTVLSQDALANKWIQLQIV